MERKFLLLCYGQSTKKISVTDGINLNVIQESVKYKFKLNDAHLKVFDSDVGEYIDLDSDADLNFEAEKIIKVRITNASTDSQKVPGATACTLSPPVNKSTKPFSGSISRPFLKNISTCSSSPTSSKINSLSSLENIGSGVPNTRKEITRSIQDIHRRLTTELTDHIDATINNHEFQCLKNLFKLTPKEIKDAHNMSSLLSILERKDIIAPGKYEKLTEALLKINNKIIREVIEPIEDEMKLQSSKLPSQEQVDSVPYTSQDQRFCRSPGFFSTETAPSYSLKPPGPDYELNIWLTKIALKLNAKNLDTMKFILGGEDGSPRSVLEKITSPLQLFSHLIDDGKLTRDNILFLQAMLYHARRIDLYKKLMEYGEKYKDTLHFYEPSCNQENGNRGVKFHVSCKKETCTNNLEDIRAKAARYMSVDIHFVSIQRLRGHK
ncbi:uncharacterized protein LOC127717933 [Mytilus californianus]|uniref:uncharacterized protein LOC127717933 n=1 Tax=Mytilus californianus TaxID=6549 RepID=UPI002247E7B1|nr:uncharacterized protein LOC127717933 [Mytilus californianus]